MLSFQIARCSFSMSGLLSKACCGYYVKRTFIHVQYVENPNSSHLKDKHQSPLTSCPHELFGSAASDLTLGPRTHLPPRDRPRRT